jgi:hypothetical protein
LATAARATPTICRPCRVDRLDRDRGVRPRLVQLSDKRIALRLALIIDRAGYVTRLQKTLGPAKLLFSQLELGGNRFDLRKVLDLECLTIANPEPRLRLSQRRKGLFGIRLGLLYCLALLFDRCTRLLEADLRIPRIEPNKHASLRDIASDIEIHFDDLAADRRCDIRLCVTCQITRRLDIGRDRNDRRRRCRDIDHRRFAIGIIRGRRVRVRAAARNEQSAQ